jgi:hypothetical protein
MCSTGLLYLRYEAEVGYRKSLHIISTYPEPGRHATPGAVTELPEEYVEITNARIVDAWSWTKTTCCRQEVFHQTLQTWRGSNGLRLACGFKVHGAMLERAMTIVREYMLFPGFCEVECNTIHVRLEHHALGIDQDRGTCVRSGISAEHLPCSTDTLFQYGKG